MYVPHFLHTIEPTTWRACAYCGIVAHLEIIFLVFRVVKGGENLFYLDGSQLCFNCLDYV